MGFPAPGGPGLGASGAAQHNAPPGWGRSVARPREHGELLSCYAWTTSWRASTSCELDHQSEQQTSARNSAGTDHFELRWAGQVCSEEVWFHGYGGFVWKIELNILNVLGVLHGLLIAIKNHFEVFIWKFAC